MRAQNIYHVLFLSLCLFSLCWCVSLICRKYIKALACNAIIYHGVVYFFSKACRPKYSCSVYDRGEFTTQLAWARARAQPILRGGSL